MESTSITGAAAASVALFHTLAGPDHYVPFIALARSRGWPAARLVAVTVGCGLAHVASSVVLGLAGALAGAALSTIERIRDFTGSAAGYGLVVLGAIYAVWGLWRGLRGLPHQHLHIHQDGTLHYHAHDHAQLNASQASGGHSPSARQSLPGGSREKAGLGGPAWALFLIFAFGPCEPLIALSFPLGLARAWSRLAWVSMVFSSVTILTMVIVVLVVSSGLARLRFSWLERYVHLLSGLAIFASGGAIVWLGL